MEKKKRFTRHTAMTLIFVILFLTLFFRLADMQIVQGENYRKLAQDKSIRSIDDDAPRGKILDRSGLELATVVESYTVFMMKPQDEQEKESLMHVIEKLVAILNENHEQINDDFNIIIKQDSGGKRAFEFDFPNNYEDESKKQEYIQNASVRWVKEKGLADDISNPQNPNPEEAFNLLIKKYGIDPAEKKHRDDISFIRQMLVVRQMIADMGYMAYKPVEIAYVSKETAFQIMERSIDLPGVDYKVKPLRKYPLGQLASTVIGSLRKIPASKKEEYEEKHYDVNTDLIGRDGIEAYAEADLRGEKGGRTVRVDAYGRIAEELGKRDPVPGNNVVLTIDADLQKFAEDTLDKNMALLRSGQLKTRKGAAKKNATRGAAVVIDIKTGEVLAMASRPGGYDPNVMAETGSFTEEVRKLLYPINEEHPNVDPERILQPAFNYATRGAVPPGSTFKMVTATAGLETGAITASTPIIDRGQYRVVPGFFGNCWMWNYYHGSHGRQTVVDALKNSCNYFFFDVGRRVKLDNLAKYAKMYGLSDEPSGIEIFEEPGDCANAPAIKANAEAYAIKATLQTITAPGYDSAAGAFNPTEEQKNVIVEVIKNDKNLRNSDLSAKLKAANISSYKIRRKILDASLDVYNEYSKPGLALNAAIGQGENRFTPLQVANYIATIANNGTRLRPHLVRQIVRPDGTVLKDVQPEVMERLSLKANTLKTVISGMDAVTGEGGTAGSVFRKVSVKVAGKTGTATASGGRDDYSWFAGFAPANSPEIAVAVVIHEGGGYGSSNTAADIFNYYFARGNSKPETR